MSGPIVAGRPVAPGRQRGILPPARYRHPGDVIRLLVAGLVFAGAAAATLATHGTYAGASATAVTTLRLSTTAGRVLTGLMTAAFAVAAVAAIATTLRYRRFRLLASLAGGALLTAAVLIGITGLAGGERPQALSAGTSQWPRLIGPSLASPLLGAVAAGVVTAAPWLSRSWRRTACCTGWPPIGCLSRRAGCRGACCSGGSMHEATYDAPRRLHRAGGRA